ncbi:MAG: FxsA family protein [Halodesulfurarchaeum sp.]
MLRWILAGLLLIPLADIALLVVVAGMIGWAPTVALVVLTALLGMLFVRAEGRHTLKKMQRSLAQGDPPTNEVIDGGLLIAAGAFLLTPGLVTDAVGFLLAFPLSRAPIRVLLKRYVISPMLDRRTGGFATGRVYTAGFPNGGSSGGTVGATGPWNPGPDGADESDAGTVDLGPDEYDISGDDREH